MRERECQKGDRVVAAPVVNEAETIVALFMVKTRNARVITTVSTTATYT